MASALVEYGLRKDEDLEQFIADIDTMIQEWSSNKAWNCFGLYVSHGVTLGTVLRLQWELTKRGWVVEEDSDHNYPHHPFIKYIVLKASFFDVLLCDEDVLNMVKAKILDLKQGRRFSFKVPQTVNLATFLRIRGEVAKYGFTMETNPTCFEFILERETEFICDRV